MTRLFARDSIVWWLAIIGAAVTYLISAGEPPPQWDYQQWLQALSFGVATIAGKLATSPMPSTATIERREAAHR